MNPVKTSAQAATASAGSCRTRSFWSLMVAQFLGALNDNIFKLSVSLIALAAAASGAGSALYVGLGTAVFVVPFILFAPLGGYLADRFSKTHVIRFLKAAEIAIAAGAVAALAAHHLSALFVLLFLMGLHSALFGSAKYGIMPELLEHHHLSRGNGYMQFWTFAAIIIGTACGGKLIAVSGGDYRIVGYAVLAVAAAGFAASLGIRVLPAADPKKRFDWNGFKTIVATLRSVAADRNMMLAMIAAMYFSFAGSLLHMNILLYAKQTLLVNDDQISRLLLALALGIGVGSVGAGKISEGKVELGLVPMGAFGMSALSFVLGFVPLSFNGVAAVLFGIGLSGGLYIVPLNAFIQRWSPKEQKGAYLAASTFMSFGSILVSAILFWLLKDHAGVSPQGLFILTGVMTAGILWIILGVLPAFLVRCLNWILTHTLYRVKVIDDSYVPETGGALLVANHASYADPSILMASIDRPVRFVMARNIYEFMPLKPFAKAIGAIPISGGDSPKKIAQALETAATAIRTGELVCIFAEGGHTRTGQLLQFKAGLERIMRGQNAPIIPVHLDKVWGSVLSYKGGRYFWKVPARMPYPVTVAFGKPLAAETKASEVRLAVQELSSRTFAQRSETHRCLHLGFLDQVKAHPFKPCMADSLGIRLNYAQAFAGALSLSRFLRKADDAEGEMVGVVLPASAAAALVNTAVLIAGKIPVNLNFTASKDSVASSVRQCAMRRVITSRKFAEKIGWETPAGVTAAYVEDLFAAIPRGEKALCFAATLLLPKKAILNLLGTGMPGRDQTATVIFSSGSTGEPKGVMLTHENIASNVQAVYDVVRMKRDDKVVGVLPFFHSFGFTGTLWLPLLAGISAVYHANPLDASTIGKLTQNERGTILMSTPTFLTAYTRKCAPEHFAGLRHVIVGAEKLKESIADAFKDRFGIEPLEGYGATELSPIAALNIEDYRADGVTQIGTKRGKIGRPLPGVAVKITDPETGSDLGTGRDGLLWVLGPNVMKGYLGRDEMTREVIRDGWYNTGDIANIDDEGFVTITDRLSRFSKVGGEMVPHVKIEDALHRAAGAVERVFAVTAVPDERKGEKIIVLYTGDADPALWTEKLVAEGLPALWIPKKDQFVRIDAFPTLGSGKLDLKGLKQIALEKTSGVLNE